MIQSIADNPCSSQITTNSKIFTTSDPDYIFLDANARRRNRYLLSPMPATLNGIDDTLFAYSGDTEYWHEPWAILLAQYQVLTRQVVTCQFQHVFLPYPHVIVHPDFHAYMEKQTPRLEKNPKHSLMSSGFAPFDYLQWLLETCVPGRYQLRLYRELDQFVREEFPKCVFLEYGFFSVVDQYPQVTGDYMKDLDFLVRQEALDMGKRLRARCTQWDDTCPTRWVLTINEMPYHIHLCKADLGALYGHMKLESVAEMLGIPMVDKAFMHEDKRIERIHTVYHESMDKYHDYSVGDVQVPYLIFQTDAHLLDDMHHLLRLDAYYDGEAPLTVGKRVLNVYKSALFNHAMIPPDDKERQQQLIDNFCVPASPWFFSREVGKSAHLLSKTFGGRCYNPRPTYIRGEGAWCDIDGKGAYARSQQQQLVPLGLPLLYSYKLSNRHTRHRTLRRFLEIYRWGTPQNQLVPGAWYAVVSSPTDTELIHGQDLIPSWFDFRYRDLRSPVPQGMIDEQDEAEDVDANSGQVKIFSHQIVNGPITHDFLQWLFAVASDAQREELLDSLRIETSLVYPACKRVNSIDALYQHYEDYQGESYCEEIFSDDGNVTIDSRDDEGFFWYGPNLGDLLITQLRLERDKTLPKTPLNEQLKLTINTLYGDMTSRFFSTSNVVVANSITARVRQFIWYAEKALYTVQSITDGGMFDLNHVLFPLDDRPVTSAMITLLMDAHDITKERHLTLRPLGGYERITLKKEGKTVTLVCVHANGDTETFTNDDAKRHINTLAFAHVKRLFPGDIDVLKDNVFEFEVKNFYNKVSFHGCANYCGDGEDVSMRSYEKHDHYSAELDNDRLILGAVYDTTTPAKYFMQALNDDPTRIPRSRPFVKNGILKFKAYNHNYTPDYDELPIIQPGQTIKKVGLLREHSPSQYTYRTLAQYRAIMQQWQSLKRKYEQSYEMFFLDKGYLRYADMVNTLHTLIRSGEHDLKNALDPDRNIHRHAQHPDFDLLRALRRFVKSLLKTHNDFIIDDAVYGEDDEDTESFRYRAND